MYRAGSLEGFLLKSRGVRVWSWRGCLGFGDLACRALKGKLDTSD